MYRRLNKANNPLDPKKYNIIKGSKPDGNWENFKPGRDEISEGATIWVGPKGGYYFNADTGTKTSEDQSLETKPKKDTKELKKKKLEDQLDEWRKAEPPKLYKPSHPANPTYVGSIAQMARDANQDFTKFATSLLSTDLVVIDYETTGLSDAGNWPIQFGAVRVRNGKIIDRFHAYMNPEDKLGEWSKANLKRLKEDGEFEGLTDDWLSAQSSMKEVHEKIIKFIGESPVCAQNSRFDLEVMTRTMKKSGIEYKPKGILDTLSFARDLIKKEDLLDKETGKPLNPGSKNPYELKNLAHFFGVDLDNAHSADEDAQATGEIAYKLIEYGLENGPLRSDFLDVDKYYSAYAARVRKFYRDDRKYPERKAEYDAAMIEWRSKDPTLKKSVEGAMLSLCFQMAAEALRYGKYR